MSQDEQKQSIEYKLLRQLKLLNFWITFFGSLFLLVLVIGGVLLWQVIAIAKDTTSKLDAFQEQTSQTFDVKSQACNDSSLGQFLRANSSVCE